MTTVVLDIDLSEPVPTFDSLAGYDRALILFRYAGRPFGKAALPVRLSRIDEEKLREALARVMAEEGYWRSWVQKEFRLNEPEPGGAIPKATVAVCTRDRPDDLEDCLRSLLELPDDGQEILVVDSCSASDETRQVAGRFPGVRYVREDLPGLDRARNRALREARHDLVLFIDDDARPDRNWLRALVKEFDDPSVMCVTGLTMPLEMETEAQEMFEQYAGFSRGFERRVFDWKIVSPLTVGKVGAGVNMGLRRSVIERIGPFDEALDAGTPTCSGGEAEMFSRILSAGYRIVYTPAALNWHRHRRSRQELRKTIYGYGVGIYAFWTQKLLLDRELTAVWVAWSWFWNDQLPALLRALLGRPGAKPLDLVLAELRGCLAGPWAYLRSQRRLAMTRP